MPAGAGGARQVMKRLIREHRFYPMSVSWNEHQERELKNTLEEDREDTT
jgi:hypothetical protein